MVALAALPTRRDGGTVLVARTPAAALPPVVPAAVAAKPSVAELDEEATAAPLDDQPDEPAPTPDMSLLLVKSVPQ